jgi:hypothetical protein
MSNLVAVLLACWVTFLYVGVSWAIGHFIVWVLVQNGLVQR